MHRLLNIGFRKVGDWKIVNQKPKPALTDLNNISNVLYAFVCEGNVYYVGKTVRSLKSRIYNYENPGKSQITNIKVKRNINCLLLKGKKVEIYALPDSGLFAYGDFHMNLAAALEDSIIRILDPPWNGSDKYHLDHPRKELSPAQLDVNKFKKKDKLFQEKPQYDHLGNSGPKFRIKLGEAYYNQGFFNLTRKYDKYIGEDGCIIEICFSDTDEILRAKINRTANLNGTARIMGGKRLKNWIRSRYVEGDVIEVEIISKHSIRLGKKEV